MKPEEHSELNVEVEGWPLRVTTYKLDGTYHSTADNVSPGANLARTTGATKEEAETKALNRAQELLSRTQRRTV